MKPVVCLFVRPLYLIAVGVTCVVACAAQDAANVAAPPDNERWNLFYQATSIGQYHGAFNALYSGPNSLANHPEAEASLTTTLFFVLRLTRNTSLVFDPEIAGGRGFS